MATNSDKILAQTKGLRDHLEEGELPLLAIPGIWDNGQQEHKSTLCDVLLTNRRIFGYIYKTFPRESLFLDALPLSEIRQVTIRRKSYSPLRELLVKTGTRTVYIRASQKQIDQLNETLRSQAGHSQTEAVAPTYERQEVKGTFESSSLGISLLFVGGLFLEVVGVLLWYALQSAPTGLPLCIAGLLAVGVATYQRRQQNKH